MNAHAQRETYKQVMGREPPAPRPDDPLAWQWKYKGTKQERERLAVMVVPRKKP